MVGTMTSLMLTDEYRQYLIKRYNGITEGIRALISRDMAQNIIKETDSDEKKIIDGLNAFNEEVKARVAATEATANQIDAAAFVQKMNFQIQDYHDYYTLMPEAEFNRFIQLATLLAKQFRIKVATAQYLLFLGRIKGSWWTEEFFKAQEAGELAL